MVSNVAVENVARAARGILKVYHRQCGVFGCGATRANSRSVGEPSFWRVLPACPRSRSSRNRFTQAVLIVNGWNRGSFFFESGIESSIESGYIQIPRAESI